MFGKTVIKDGKIFLDNGYGTTYCFEIVEHVDDRYSVWNIPKLLDGEYIPFGQVNDDFRVNVNTLKAVKVSPHESEIVRKAASEGYTSINVCKRILSRKVKSERMKRRQSIASDALSILETIYYGRSE